MFFTFSRHFMYMHFQNLIASEIFTYFHLFSLICTYFHMFSLVFTCFHSDALSFTFFHFFTLSFTLVLDDRFLFIELFGLSRIYNLGWCCLIFYLENLSFGYFYYYFYSDITNNFANNNNNFRGFTENTIVLS